MFTIKIYKNQQTIQYNNTWHDNTRLLRQDTRHNIWDRQEKDKRHKTWDKQDKKEIMFKMLKRLLPEMNKPEQL